MTETEIRAAEPSVMALHGSASHPAQWSRFAAMAPNGFHVTTEAMPGYHSRPVDTSATGLLRRAEPLIAQIQAGRTPVHVVGHSFGGAVALKIAVRRPDLVASLTMYEPVLPQILRDDQTPEEHAALAQLLGVSARLTASVATGHPEDGVAGFIDFWNGPGAWQKQPMARRKAMAQQAVNIMADFHDAVGDDLSLKDLGRMTVPMRLISGTASPEVSHAMVARVMDHCPTVEHICLQGLGHMAPLTHPDAVARPMWEHIVACSEGVITPVINRRAA